MKRIKMLAAVAIFCTAGFAGFAAYDKATMTDEEKFMLANIEALSWYEVPNMDDNCLLNPIFYQGWGASICSGGHCTYQSNHSAPLNNPTYGSCN